MKIPIPHIIKEQIKAWIRSIQVWHVRHKRQINVVFVVNEVAIWKTESLYREMLGHSRFMPVLAVSPTREIPDAHLKMVDYLNEKQYKYYLLDTQKTITKQLPADILVYEKPYDTCVSAKHIPSLYKLTLMVYAPYGFTNIMEPWSYNCYLYKHLWQYYHENRICAQATIDHLEMNKKSVIVTGTPMMDDLAQPKEVFQDPWKDKLGRKRIIYAPHHTIGDQHLSGISYSTFLEYGEYMLELAQKYSDKTYWAFKPHPLLETKLKKEWGEDKTNRYYEAWQSLENAQVEKGKYIGLFKYSDAMIHDCSTFTQEYIYANRPVMYLIKDEHHTDNLNDFAKATFNLHIHGKSKADIEKFVLDVIQTKDVKKQEREAFHNDMMLPPHGKTACENIINAILGEKEYKR